MKTGKKITTEERLVLIEKLKIENTLDELSEYIQKTVPDGQKRFKHLLTAFNKKYPKRNYKRGAAEAMTWSLLSVPLSLYFMGLNSAVFVELHGFLESFILRDLPQYLANSKQSASIISSFIGKKTLNELAAVLFALKIWDKEDLRFVRTLSNIRNGIVHKNTKLVSKYLGDGKDIHISDIDNLISKADCPFFIIETIELMVKLALAAKTLSTRRRVRSSKLSDQPIQIEDKGVREKQGLVWWLKRIALSRIELNKLNKRSA